MKYREVVIRIEASVPEDKDEEAYHSELYGAIDDVEARIAKEFNWSYVRPNGVRLKVSTP